MSFFELVEHRYSARNFSTKPVEKSKLVYLLETARLAPSAVNFQPWKFVVVTQLEMMSKIHACYHRDWFKTAHTCIIVLGDHEQSWKRKDGKDHCDIDTSIAIDHITLAAAEQGLGTCWVCNFDIEKLREVLELPSHIEPIAILPVGYVAEGIEIPEKKRKKLNEIVSWIE